MMASSPSLLRMISFSPESKTPLWEILEGFIHQLLWGVSTNDDSPVVDEVPGSFSSPQVIKNEHKEDLIHAFHIDLSIVIGPDSSFEFDEIVEPPRRWGGSNYPHNKFQVTRMGREDVILLDHHVPSTYMQGS